MNKIPAGYKKTEVGIIPEDWVVFAIENLTPQNRQYTIVDGPFGSNLKTIHYRKSGIPIITSGFVTEGKFFATEYLYVDLSKFKQEKRSAVRGGDIVMAKIGERCGASAILPINHPEGILSGNALKITIDENRFSKDLIAQILWHHHVKGNFEILRTTGAQPAISMANLKKYKIPLPQNLSEQTAIATALNDADALITQLEKLIAKKRLIKQGAIQQLLTGKKRLAGFDRHPDGRPKGHKQTALGPIPEDWNIYKLSELVNMKSGVSITSKHISLDGKYPCYGGNGLRGYTDQFTHSGRFALIGRQGALCGNVQFVSGDFFASEHAIVVTPKANTEIKLLYYVLIEMNLNQYSESSAQPGLSVAKILDLPLPYSANLAEQTAIATIITDMETEIEALETRLAKYKQIKLGIMQSLLTGKVRLQTL